MAFQLTKHDQDLVKSIVLLPGGIIPVSEFPSGGPNIVFQFPPNVTSDGKKYIWKEYGKSFVWEPVYVWGGGRPREITIKATYIVGGPGTNGSGKPWTAANVATETRRWKSYFYSGGNLGGKLPVFQLVMYQNAPIPGKPEKGKPPGHITIWRGLSISLKYGDTLVSDDGDANSTFPLKTDITLKLALVSNITSKDGKVKQFGFKGADQPPAKPEELWY